LKNRYIAIIAIILAALMTVLIPSASIAYQNSPPSKSYIFMSLKPLPRKNSWQVNISASIEGEHFGCNGVVEANPYYRETRAVSATLLSAPLYYVLDSVCPNLTLLLDVINPAGLIHIVINVPKNYYIYTAMDSRGYGSHGRYTLPLGLFVHQYLFDGIVVASKKYYIATKIHTIALIEPRNSTNDYTAIARVVECVSSFLRKELGSSNRSPVVLVVAASWDHPYMLTGVGYSLGSVIYVKPGAGLGSLVHLIAHETVHSWIGKGRLQGGPSLVEGAAELLSLLALSSCNKEMYKKDLLYEEISQEANPYDVWLRLHAAIRGASIYACKRDLYIEALRLLYGQGKKDANIFDLLMTIKKLANNYGCLDTLEKYLGKALLSAGSEPLKELLNISLSQENRERMQYSVTITRTIHTATLKTSIKTWVRHHRFTNSADRQLRIYEHKLAHGREYSSIGTKPIINRISNTEHSLKMVKTRTSSSRHTLYLLASLIIIIVSIIIYNILISKYRV